MGPDFVQFRRAKGPQFRLVFGQNGRHIYEETVVKTRGEAWLVSKNIELPTGGAAAWVFEDVCAAIDLRAWEFAVDEKHTYCRVEEQ